MVAGCEINDGGGGCGGGGGGGAAAAADDDDKQCSWGNSVCVYVYMSTNA